MSRYIDAEKLKDLYQPIDGKDYKVSMDIIRLNIDDIPTADVEEVRHGKWVKDKSKMRGDGEIYDYCCSRCCGLAGKNDYNNYSILSAYCPHCGAKMDGE